jgi:putative spermidine/putrescine transport system ATP-binding protein
MLDLALINITKQFGHVTAVSDVDLHLDGGNMVSFLGPSGCGKTTLLRMIAGLDLPTQGQIRLGERDITHTPAHQRNMGMVFQSLALFPHLSVGENITYGLKIRGMSRDERRLKAEQLLELVRLPGIADRHISQLSGGQRPCRRWTPTCAKRCRSNFASCSRDWASPPSSSLTTRARP